MNIQLEKHHKRKRDKSTQHWKLKVEVFHDMTITKRGGKRTLLPIAVTVHSRIKYSLK